MISYVFLVSSFLLASSSVGAVLDKSQNSQNKIQNPKVSGKIIIFYRSTSQIPIPMRRDIGQH